MSPKLDLDHVQVLRVIAEDGPISVADIARQEKNISRSRATFICRYLRTQGMVNWKRDGVSKLHYVEGEPSVLYNSSGGSDDA